MIYIIFTTYNAVSLDNILPVSNRCNTFTTMRIVAHILMLLHGFAFLLQPMGNPTSMNFQEMYQQCSVEDHDITPLDFVFEHLLNFECVINYFEGEDQEEHQPFQTIEFSAPIAVTMPKPLSIIFSQHSYDSERVVYTIENTKFCSSNFYADIFHPPIV